MNVLGITLGKRSQQLLRILGYVALGLVSFVFALQMTFPYSRVKDRIAEALSAKYDVVIGGVERGFLPGKMILQNVSLKSRPTQPHQTPTLFYIKELSLDVGVLALIGKKVVVDVEAQLGDGTLTGVVKLSKDDVQLRFASDSLPGASLPFKELVGLPVIGKIALDIDFDLRLVRNRVDWTKAAGHLQLECPSGCTVGDGKTKIRPAVTRPNQAEFVKDGIEFNRLALDKFEARLEVKKGKAEITKWNVPSKDGEIHLDFEAKLEPLLNDSQVTGCLRFNGSADLEKRDYRTLTQLRTLGAPLGPDKLFHIRLTGPLRQVKRLAQICGPGADVSKTGSSGSGVSGSGGSSPNERRGIPSQSEDGPRPPPSPDGVTATPAPPPPPPSPPPPNIPNSPVIPAPPPLPNGQLPPPLPNGQLPPPLPNGQLPPPLPNGQLPPTPDASNSGSATQPQMVPPPPSGALLPGEGAGVSGGQPPLPENRPE
jgi:type II secretion system protein N